METYIAFGIFVVILIVTMLGKGVYDDRKKRKQFIRKLYNDYGKITPKEYKPEQYASIARFYKKNPKEYQIDDITWNDLSLDDVFKSMNETYSSAGEEYLYYKLRTPSFDEKELTHFDDVAEYFSNEPDERVTMQLVFAELGKTGKFSIYDYLEHLDIWGNRSNLKHLIANALFIIGIALLFIQASYGLVFLISLMIFNMITYFKEKNEIDTYITSFAYVMRLLKAADKLGKLNIEVCKEELENIKIHKKELSRFRRGSFWLMSSGRMSGSGNPIDIFLDYMRMTFHLDLMKFNKMLIQVRAHLDDINALLESVGYLETSIAVGVYRKSLEDEWCQPKFSKDLTVENLYHPLIGNPVKNSISTKKNVLLTGSNASGKSTFLKTVAIGALFAQTIYTCPADKYEGEFFYVCSSMALRDDLGKGESYYIVEIKSIKRILDIAAKTQHKVLCFVDEVLRGTNTVERIAASTQILRSLSMKNVCSFAATHDIELTELLVEYYENYHFEEKVENDDIFFNYKLLDGKATTRNAIKLLSIMGYDDTIIEKANWQAEEFMKTGVWKA